MWRVEPGMLEYNYKAPTRGDENNWWVIFSDYKHFHSKIMYVRSVHCSPFTYANNLVDGRLVSEIANPFTQANKICIGKLSGVNYNHGQMWLDSNVNFITQIQTSPPFPPFNVVIREISFVSHLPKSVVNFHMIPEMTSRIDYRQ